jgi:carbamoyltransferase
MQGSYLGPKFSNEEVEASLNSLQANFKKYDKENELISIISNKINQKKIVGWFQGRMEFGPRALGARSILADPRDEEMQKKLNLKIKFRESFRPFAPSVLSEKKEDWFDLHQESPYMLLVAQVNNEHILKMTDEQKKLFGIEKLNIKRSSLPAITHIDYSARIQTVNEKFNKRYYELLKDFYKISGCPVIINTSFNIRGEPIVCSIEDAYRCFMGTNLDVLVCENYVMFKEEQNTKLLKEYKSQFELD